MEEGRCWSFLFVFLQKIPKKFGEIKEIAYLCTVKTFKGHEAAAPKKAAYFMHGLKKQAIAAPRGVSDNDPKGTSLE